MSTYNVVLNCLKPEKKLPEVYGISFDEKQNEVVFFSHKMINKGIENYSLKKKNTQREPQPIKCSHFKVMMPLCLSVIYQLCYYTVNKKELLNQLN